MLKYNINVVISLNDIVCFLLLISSILTIHVNVFGLTEFNWEYYNSIFVVLYVQMQYIYIFEC